MDRPVHPTIAFDEWKANLLRQVSSDEKVEKPEYKFLKVEQQVSQDQDTVVMTSYPRSGNTLLRGYLEKIMGLCSGSDSDICKKLNKDLMIAGLSGEGLVDRRVMIVKTHYPERFG